MGVENMSIGRVEAEADGRTDCQRPVCLEVPPSRVGVGRRPSDRQGSFHRGVRRARSRRQFQHHRQGRWRWGARRYPRFRQAVRRRPSRMETRGWPFDRQTEAGRIAHVLHDGGQEIHLRLPEESRDETVGWPLMEIERRALLHDPALVQDDDAVRQRHRLDLIMRHVDHGRPRAAGEDARSRPASARGDRRRDWRAARRRGIHRARARSRARWRRAGADRPRAARGLRARSSSICNMAAASATFRSISALSVPSIFRAKPIFSATLMCG